LGRVSPRRLRLAAFYRVASGCFFAQPDGQTPQPHVRCGTAALDCPRFDLGISDETALSKERPSLAWANPTNSCPSLPSISSVPRRRAQASLKSISTCALSALSSRGERDSVRGTRLKVTGEPAFSSGSARANTLWPSRRVVGVEEASLLLALRLAKELIRTPV
jgi:hypothetical protein